MARMFPVPKSNIKYLVPARGTQRVSLFQALRANGVDHFFASSPAHEYPTSSDILRVNVGVTVPAKVPVSPLFGHGPNPSRWTQFIPDVAHPHPNEDFCRHGIEA